MNVKPRKSKHATRDPRPAARRRFPRPSGRSTNSTKTTTACARAKFVKTSAFFSRLFFSIFLCVTDDETLCRDSEAEYLAALSDSLSRGTTWDRICDLVELQNSQSKTLARAGPGTTELSRYREVFLRLRREGTSAPGAAGY